MIDKSNVKCMGCSACVNICPRSAITFSFENSFFYNPLVDYDKCISCKKCIEVCPSINFDTSNFFNPISYAVYGKDVERKSSTSGAAFPIMAKYILSNGGYVCGVSWDKNWNAHHIIIDNEIDLYKLRFSKYVQSNPENVFSEIKKLLEQGKTVLFSGTPCQNAGLLNYLNKSYENLYTVDLLCHGVPSPKIWQDYLDTNCNKKLIKDICFRNKENGWVTCENCFFDTNCSFIDESSIKKPIGLFYKAFISHKLSNETCLDCQFRKIPRPADFTIGDFWNYAKYDKKLNDNMGLSILLCNNKKALSFYETIQDDFELSKKINFHNHWEDIEITKKSRASFERKFLFDNYVKYGVNKSIELAIGKHYDVGLLTQFNGMNYGSSLVSYAVNEILKSMGYTTLMIHKPYNWDYPYNDENMSWRFARKHFHISRFFNRDESCRELNKLVDTFIVGSDTLWWWADVSKTNYHYWLDFVEADKKKIAFCTSFAQEETDVPIENQKQLKYLYSRFDGLSVREESGKTVLKNTYGMDSECFIDPTFIVKKQVWDDLVIQSKLVEKEYILAYILDFSKEKEQYIKQVSKILNKRVILIGNPKFHPKTDLLIKKQYEIEDFVYLFNNSEFVITDSFHGTCFSVIYKKNFISLVNARRGKGRYSIFDRMNLSQRLKYDYSTVDELLIKTDVDFSFVEDFVEEKKQSAISWLKLKMSEEKKILDTDLLFDYVKTEFENFPILKLIITQANKYFLNFIKRCIRFFLKRKKKVIFSFFILIVLILIYIIL